MAAPRYDARDECDFRIGVDAAEKGLDEGCEQ
jgi:hypothetical protein